MKAELAASRRGEATGPRSRNSRRRASSLSTKRSSAQGPETGSPPSSASRCRGTVARSAGPKRTSRPPSTTYSAGATPGQPNATFSRPGSAASTTSCAIPKPPRVGPSDTASNPVKRVQERLGERVDPEPNQSGGFKPVGVLRAYARNREGGWHDPDPSAPGHRKSGWAAGRRTAGADAAGARTARVPGWPHALADTRRLLRLRPGRAAPTGHPAGRRGVVGTPLRTADKQRPAWREPWTDDRIRADLDRYLAAGPFWRRPMGTPVTVPDCRDAPGRRRKHARDTEPVHYHANVEHRMRGEDRDDTANRRVPARIHAPALLTGSRAGRILPPERGSGLLPPIQWRRQP